MRKLTSRMFAANDGERIAFSVQTQERHSTFQLFTGDGRLSVTGKNRWRLNCRIPNGKEHHAIRLEYTILFMPGTRTRTKFVMTVRDQDGVSKNITFYRPRGTNGRRVTMTGDLVVGVK